MQLEFFDVPSPCINTCESDEKGHCLGCMRSRDERQSWGSLNNNDKQKVIKRCIQRKNKKNNLSKNTLSKSNNTRTVSSQEYNIDRQPSLLDLPSKVQVVAKPDIDFSDFEL